MTVEHDGHDGSGRAGRDDPLMAVVTGEPLSDQARADAALLAEYRSAEADVALLREQLGIIGHALGSEPAARPAPEPVPLRRPARRRPLRLALTGLAAAAAATVFAGMGWLVVQAGAGADDSAGGSNAESAADSAKSVGPLGSPGYLACTRLLVEGEVTDVVPVRGTGRERVTLDVTRSYIPAGKDGEDEATFVKGDDAVFGAPRHLRVGDDVLVAVPRHGTAADFWFVGEDDIAPQRTVIVDALPQARSMSCE
ncbi:hypothetical protein RKD49_002908 [Streptomyces glaucescens]